MLGRIPRPTIFAHRGASAYAPENTISAFKIAIQQDAHAIELDAMLSADHKVVVIDEETVDGTTDGFGEVRKMDLASLQTLDAGSHFDDQFQEKKSQHRKMSSFLWERTRFSILN